MKKAVTTKIKPPIKAVNAGKSRPQAAKKKPKAQDIANTNGDVKEGINTGHHADAAGIDVGAQEVVIALPPGRCEQPVRTFRTFTSELEALVNWVVEYGIKTVAMESTGNYWITLYDMLVAKGIDVFLVNARHVPKGPGKKTDVCDAQWLQQLHAAGLLRKSFRPDLDIVPVRFLMRHRSEMVADAAKQLQLMQKTLTEMNLKLHHAFSDIDGVSARAIIEAILAGERDPKKLATLRDPRCKGSLEDLWEALKGDYREEYLFVLGQSKETYDQLQASIAQCDVKLSELIVKVESDVTLPLPKAAKKHQHKLSKNSPQVEVFDQAWRFYGVDLSDAPGIAAGLLSTLISEVGTREDLMKSFRSAEAFSSWMGLCPDNRISGGRVLKAKTRKVNNRLATAFRLAAFGLQHSKSELGKFFRYMKGKLGRAEGITATAHKLARIVYGMIFHQTAYNEQEAFKVTPRKQAKALKALQKQAATLGFTLQPAA
jgi:transposase